MSNREEQTFDQSSNMTDDKDKHFQQSEFQDIHSRDGITMKSTASCSKIQDKFATFELEEELINRLTKLKIDDVNKLPEKIQETKERIKNRRGNDREEETEKEMQILTQLQSLRLLDGTITKLKSTRSVEDSSSVMELHRLEQELINGLAKLKIDDVNKLPEKIQETEKRIKDYHKGDKKEEAKKEIQILTPLKRLRLLDGTITKLKSTRSVEESNSVIELCWLEQELINGLEQLKVDDVNKLPEKIQETEKRIKDYREDDKKEETEKEMQILTPLKRLRLLDGTITKLKPTPSIEDSSSVMEPRRLEQELVSGLTKFKVHVRNVNKLSEKIQQTKEHIKDYREDDREEETEKEMQILMQLNHSKSLDEEITKLKSIQSVPDNIETQKICPSPRPTPPSILSTEKESLYLQALREDSVAPPLCAEKFISNLFMQFKRDYLEITQLFNHLIA